MQFRNNNKNFLRTNLCRQSRLYTSIVFETPGWLVDRAVNVQRKVSNKKIKIIREFL